MEQLDNIELWASKLQGDWSAPSIVSQISRERLQGLLRVFNKGKLDNMVKVRLLLACLFLPRADLLDLEAELRELAQLASQDDDEWVRVVGAAVGEYNGGQLDLAAVCATSSIVKTTVESLWASLDSAVPPPTYRPLQEVLLHPDVRPTSAAPPSSVPHNHFGLRDTADARALLAALDPDNLLAGSGEGAAGGPGAGLDGQRPGAPSVHARRGMLHNPEASLFISRPAGAPAGGGGAGMRPPPLHAASLGPGGGGLGTDGQTPTPGSAGAYGLLSSTPGKGHAGFLPGQRGQRMKPIDVSEAAALNAAQHHAQGRGRGGQHAGQHQHPDGQEDGQLEDVHMQGDTGTGEEEHGMEEADHDGHVQGEGHGLEEPGEEGEAGAQGQGQGEGIEPGVDGEAMEEEGAVQHQDAGHEGYYEGQEGGDVGHEEGEVEEEPGAKRMRMEVVPVADADVEQEEI